MLRFEISRCWHGRGLKFSLLISSLLAAGHFCAFCLWFLQGQQGGVLSAEYQEWIRQGIDAGSIYPATLYEGFIGGEGYTFFNQLYFYLIPIIAVLPFGASFFQDEQSGYLKHIYTRKKKSSYLVCKYAVTWMSGGTAALSAYIFSFALNALYVPAINPTQVALHTNVVDAMSMSDWYYTRPYLYFGIYGIAIFLCGGFLATLSLCISLIGKNTMFVLAFPFMAYTALDYISLETNMSIYSLRSLINPMDGAIKMEVPISRGFLVLLGCCAATALIFGLAGKYRQKII